MVDSVTGAETWCSCCGEAVTESELRACMICRRLFCHRCVVPAYGREFCSVMCRDVFFYGDDDEPVVEE